MPFTADWKLPKEWPGERPDLIFVANPNSPSGTMINPEAIGELTKRIGCPVVLDEAYVDFADRNGLKLISQPNAIVTRTLSKSYALAGIRFGFAVGNAQVIRELVKVKDSYNCDVLSLAAATAAIQDQQYLATTRRMILDTRGRLTESASRPWLRCHTESSEFRLGEASRETCETAVREPQDPKNSGTLHELSRLRRRPPSIGGNGR